MTVVMPFPHRRDRQAIATFERPELQRILELYGRMVAAGHWRDYGISFDAEVATFAAFRRASERPEIRIEKRPRLRLKQGAFALVSEHGAVLGRGHDLQGVLAPLERRLMRLVGNSDPVQVRELCREARKEAANTAGPERVAGARSGVREAPAELGI